MSAGWICPKCGAGVAPHVERCPCVPLDTRGGDYIPHPAPYWPYGPYQPMRTGGDPPGWENPLWRVWCGTAPQGTQA